MLRFLHLAHDHVSVRRLRAQLANRTGEAHTWVLCGAGKGAEADWILDVRDDLPESIRTATWDAVVVHRMRQPTPRWVLSIPDGPLFVWATWGDDYYRVFPALSRGIYLPRTRLLLGAIGKVSVNVLGAIQTCRNAVLPRSWRLTPRDWELAAMNRMDGIANLFESDFVALPFLRDRPSLFYSSWYNAIPQVVPEMLASVDPEGPILLGSSATTSGNHLDFLWDHSAEVQPTGRQVRMVMAYGSRRYARAVQWLGRKRWGSQLEWLEDRLPLEEYIRYLAECPVVVHNQVRNQNTGNAVLSFLLGQRVLMRSETFLYRYFTGLGFEIGDASADSLDLSPLPEAQRIHNRSLALQWFGDEAVMQRFEAFVNDVKAKRSRPA